MERHPQYYKVKRKIRPVPKQYEIPKTTDVEMQLLRRMPGRIDMASY